MMPHISLPFVQSKLRERPAILARGIPSRFAAATLGDKFCLATVFVVETTATLVGMFGAWYGLTVSDDRVAAIETGK
jgi:hypothetical protein